MSSSQASSGGSRHEREPRQVDTSRRDSDHDESASDYSRKGAYSFAGLLKTEH